MSPAATMTVDDSRRSVLGTADALFYSRGIAGVTMGEIRDVSGVSMRRLYSMYPSKDELVAGWLTDRHHAWMRWFTTTVDRHIAAGADAVLATFDALGEWITTSGYRGCAFINSLAETSEIGETHRAIITRHKRDLIDHLAELAARDHPEAPDWLPAALGVIVDGTIVHCTVFDSLDPLIAARSATRQLLKAIPA